MQCLRCRAFILNPRLKCAKCDHQSQSLSRPPLTEYTRDGVLYRLADWIGLAEIQRCSPDDAKELQLKAPVPALSQPLAQCAHQCGIYFHCGV